MILKVIDAGCGVGKTTAMINFMNEQPEERKFLYITPFLSEVERVKESCKLKKFKAPEEIPNKSDDFLRLISKGENISSTHALFQKVTAAILDLIQFQNYTLIIDEAADVVGEVDITQSDLKTIISQYTEIKEDGSLEWCAEDYSGRFEDYKNMIELGFVKAHSSSKGETFSLIKTFPIKIFEAFKEVYILTYMFNGQKAYYEYNNVDIRYLYVKDFHITETPQKYDYSKQKALISVVDDDKLNAIGEGRGSLSVAWFKRNSNSPLMKQLKNNLYNFFRNKTNSKAKENLWTTFKEYKKQLQGKGYTNSFVPISIRATNEYRETTAVAYLANRYMVPTLKHFFEKSGIEVDEESFALSELIQFVYRSAIRDGKPITVYIPSKRMRDLFVDWLSKKNE